MIDAVDDGSVEGLVEGDIVIDCLTFLVAGYETTSRTLAFATYLLAIHPEAQERLNNEIHDYYEENPVSESNQHLFCDFNRIKLPSLKRGNLIVLH